MFGRLEPGRSEPGRFDPGRFEPGRSSSGRLPGRVLGRSGRLDWLPPGRVTPGWFEPGRERSGRDVPGRDGRDPVLGMLGRLVLGIPVLGRLVPGRFVLKLGGLMFGRLKLLPPTCGMLV